MRQTTWTPVYFIAVILFYCTCANGLRIDFKSLGPMLSGPGDLLSLNAWTILIFSDRVTVSHTMLEGIGLLRYFLNSFWLVLIFVARICCAIHLQSHVYRERCWYGDKTVHAHCFAWSCFGNAHKRRVK